DTQRSRRLCTCRRPLSYDLTYSTTPTAVFFFNDPATPEIYTLSLHDALPISRTSEAALWPSTYISPLSNSTPIRLLLTFVGMPRSEERFSRNAETDLVCRLLLEKKKETDPLMDKGQSNRDRSTGNQHHERYPG